MSSVTNKASYLKTREANRSAVRSEKLQSGVRGLTDSEFDNFQS
mgnify:FL=1|jgi:hypothetical protein